MLVIVHRGRTGNGTVEPRLDALLIKCLHCNVMAPFCWRAGCMGCISGLALL